MKVRVGLACLSLLISCWYCTTSSVSAASNGARPRRHSRRATLNEYLTPPAAPNPQGFRGPGFSRHPRQQHLGASQPPPPRPPPSSLPFRHGKILNAPPRESPGYFSRLMGWLNPFGSSSAPAPPAVQQQRQDNGHQETNLNSGHLQPPPPPKEYGPPAASYGPPAPSYRSPTNSYEGYASAQNLPRNLSPQGGQAYLPPQKSKNCDPCNQIPWMPLYHGMNTLDSRYAAGSADILPSESSEVSLNPHDANGAPNIYHVPSLSHEVKIPDFGYGPPPNSPSTSVLDPNHRASSSSVQLNNNNNNNYNQNLNFVQTEYPSPFTGPIPNPHLYPGAMPPLFKAKPFDSQPQGTDTSFQPPLFTQFNNHDSSSFGEAKGDNLSNGLNTGGPSFEPFSDLSSPFPGSQDHHFSQSSSKNGGFNPSIDHQPNSSHQSGTSLDEGYVDELPPGAEAIPSGPDDQVLPASLDKNHANDNGVANLDYRQNLHSSIDHESTADTSSITFGAVKTDPVEHQEFQGIKTNSGNVRQVTSYGTQVSTDGQHIIHYEQSPIIDLSSSGGGERRKDSNDSSASSSTSSGALEDPPPVILQNPDGTYGINATWSIEDSSKIRWPEDDGIGTETETVTASTLLAELTSESGVKLENIGDSRTHVSTGSSISQNNGDDFTGYSKQSLQNDTAHREQDFQDSRNDNHSNPQRHEDQQSGENQESRQDVTGQSERPETSRQHNQASLSPYPGLIRFEDSDSYGFRLPDPPVGSSSEEPFLQALMKSYNNYKMDVVQNRDQGLPRSEYQEAWFDPRQIHPGASFQPSLKQPQPSGGTANAEKEKVRSENRHQGAKKNKQVQIIIPYTRQNTPEPFQPLRNDWSTKTLSFKTQARKVPIFETNREYLAQETRSLEDEISNILQSLENSSRAKEVTESPNRSKANTSIDVLRLQKNIDNWTIQEYSRGTTASTSVPKSSRPYLSPSKKIPTEYFTTTEPVVPSTIPIGETRKEAGNILAGFSFNDLEHEGAASDQINISHVEVSSHINEVSSMFPPLLESTTATSITMSTSERNSWEQLPVSISSLNKERVYVVTPQTITTLSTTRRNKSEDKFVKHETKKNSKKEPDLDEFESIERAYQVLPQAVNNLVVSSTGPAGIPLWGIMEHEKYASPSNTSTTPQSPILYAGHSKVSHTRQ